MTLPLLIRCARVPYTIHRTLRRTLRHALHTAGLHRHAAHHAAHAAVWVLHGTLLTCVLVVAVPWPGVVLAPPQAPVSVPEPSSAAILGLGALGVLGLRRR